MNSNFTLLRVLRVYTRIVILVLLAFVLLALFASSVQAGPGDLDSSFGNGGVRMHYLIDSYDASQDALLQPDGKIVVAGWVDSVDGTNFVLVRHLANGTLDNAFGVGGFVITDMIPGVDTEGGYAEALALQPDGKIVVAGFVPREPDQLALARYLPNGDLDESFGSRGRLITSLDMDSEFFIRIGRVLLQGDGTILVSATSGLNWDMKNLVLARYQENGDVDDNFGNNGISIHTSDSLGYPFAGSPRLQSDGKIVVSWLNNDGTILLTRFRTDGSLDPDFGSGGHLTTNVPSDDFGPDSGHANLAIDADGDLLVAGGIGALENSSLTLSRYQADGTFVSSVSFSQSDIPFHVSVDVEDVALQADGKILVATASGSFATYHSLIRFHAKGGLDTDFGEGGIVDVGTVAGPSTLLVQPDQNILLSSSVGPIGTISANHLLRRFLPSGELDTTFGDDGYAIESISGKMALANAIVLQPDGKILVTGQNEALGNYDFATTRYLADGTLDPSFSDDSFALEGIVRTNIGEVRSGIPSQDAATSIAVQPDGKIVLAGYTDRSGQGATRHDFALARLNPDGSLDTNFGNGGRVITPVSEGYDEIHAMILQPDGKILVAGRAFPGTNFIVARYLADGKLDTTFGVEGSGIVRTQFTFNSTTTEAIALQPDGKIVVGGSATVDGFNSNTGASFTAAHFALARYNSDGTPDESFDGDGKATTAVGPEANNVYITGLVVQPDGKIMASGGSLLDFSLVRFNPDGSLDTTFGNEGKVITRILPGNVHTQATALLQQPDGKSIVGGYVDTVNSGDVTDFDFALVRYLPNGNLDSTFGIDGKVITSLGMGNTLLTAMARQNDGKVVAVGHGQSFANLEPQFSLARYTTSNSPQALHLENSQISENQPAGAVVGTLNTTDADSGDVHSYTFVDNANFPSNTLFTLSNTELRTNASFDFESKSTHSIRIRTTDAAGSWLEETFTIDVIDVNEAPVTFQLDSSQIEENRREGTSVGHLSTTDLDSGDSHTYSLVETESFPDNHAFLLTGNQLISQQRFDFEQKSTYDLRIRATDAGGLTLTLTLQITVIDKVEEPGEDLREQLYFPLTSQ